MKRRKLTVRRKHEADPVPWPDSDREEIWEWCHGRLIKISSEPDIKHSKCGDNTNKLSGDDD